MIKFKLRASGSFLLLLVAISFPARADLTTLSFGGFRDGQTLESYDSQGWTMWVSGSDPYGFRAVAAGDPFYTGADALYAPYGNAWFIQIRSGTPFVPAGDSITIAGLDASGSTAFDVVGFYGASAVFYDRFSVDLSFPSTTTVKLSGGIAVTSLEFAPASPLDYQILQVKVGTVTTQVVSVPEPTPLLAVGLVVAFAGATLMRRRCAGP